MTVTEITDATFTDAIATGVVVVDFWAPWCGPCRQLSPVLAALATTRPDITFTALNIDENPAATAAAQITSVPTVNIYQDGHLIDQVIGAHPGPVIAARLP